MGERKGQNKYYPPDFDPQKHKNLNAYHGTHALRERARKLDKGILIIRFEMPYNIWCDGCKAHIAMGVRYNAEKTKVGMYFTTPIFQFRMKCHLCDQHFEIKTDPANCDYVIISGAKRKEQRWDMGENEQIVTDEKSDIKRLSADPMFKLEHDSNDKSKLVKLMPTLRELEEAKSEWKDDYRLNSLMRGVLRTEKKAINEQKIMDKKFLDKWNINIDLVRENEDDIKIASLYKFNSLSSETSEKSNELSRQEKRKSIEHESIFDYNEKNSKLKKNDSQIAIKNSLSNDSKKTQINSLKQKLNKSLQEKKLVSNNLNTELKLFHVTSNDSNKTDNQLKETKNLIVKKNNKNQINTINKPKNLTLVSNDYDFSSSDNSDSETKK